MHTHAYAEVQPAATSDWERYEWWLCCLLVGSRIWVTLLRWGEAIGFDPHHHLEMLSVWRWWGLSPPLFETFYAYHPPLSFLLARSVHLFGFDPVASVQIVSLAASLVAFFALRSALQHLGLLSHPVPLCFLYLTSSLPIQVYLATSINIDVLLLALASVVLCFSLQLYWEGEPAPWVGKRSEWWARRLIIVMALCSAILTKFSGILLLALPLLVALTAPRRAGGALPVAVTPWRTPALWQRCGSALAMAAVAIVIVSPHYMHRYYRTAETFFPGNADVFEGVHQREAREARDRSLPDFFLGMFLPPKAAAESHEFRDMSVPRLLETWRDLWRRDVWLGVQPPLSQVVTGVYLRITPYLLLIGVGVLLLRRPRDVVWRRLGLVLLLFSVLLLLALVKYTYDFPWGGAVLMKGIYVAPIAWLVGYLLVGVLELGRFAPALLARREEMVHRSALVLIGGFTLVNHILPVY